LYKKTHHLSMFLMAKFTTHVCVWSSKENFDLDVLQGEEFRSMLCCTNDNLFVTNIFRDLLSVYKFFFFGCFIVCMIINHVLG
jgi:hypothetical protein